MNKQIQFLLSFFEVKCVEDIKWAHAVNNQKKLNQFCETRNIMMIEGDISLSPEGKVIMKHLPEMTSNLKYDDWLEQVSNSRKGAKLDFKDPQTISYCLKKLRDLGLEIPIFLSADILLGPGGNASKFDGVKFIKECSKYYPKGIISLGWTTEYVLGQGYTENMINNMLKISRSTESAVSFCIRVCYLKSVLPKLQSLLSQENHTITLWNGKKDPPLPHNLKEFIEKKFGFNKVFYDLINKE